MNIFVIGNDNAQNGTLFPIGPDFYQRTQKKEAEKKEDYNPNKENRFWLVKPTHSSWRYPSLLTKNHFIINLNYRQLPPLSALNTIIST